MSEISRKMKAVRFHDYGAASVLSVEHVQRPDPKAGEVLVRVHAAAVNAMDWRLRAGHLKEYMPLQLPHTPGYEFAGVVEELGEGVAGFGTGDRVFGRGSGTYAEYAVAPVATIAHMPQALSFEQATTLGMSGVTAWVGLFDVAQLQPGQRVLVHGGAGGVGSLAVQLARWKGAHVSATTSTANVDHVRSLGADEVIDYTATRFEDAVRGVDVVFDAVGGDVTQRSWDVIKPGGILAVVASMPDPEQAAAHGVRTGGVMPPEDTRSILAELAELVASGAVQAPIGDIFALADAHRAYAASETGHGRGRKVLRVAD
jgi:NADPH:quinone reductase-like Zn-dependent oxidoreductase